jgi:hypothetical protein
MSEENILELPRLKGLLRMIDCADPLAHYDFNPQLLNETQKILERRRRTLDYDVTDHSEKLSFHQLVSRNRFVFFFIVQRSGKYHSSHALSLRLRLAAEYHDSISTFFVSLNDDPDADTLFCQGTGFAIFPSSPTMMTLLNVTQVPSLVIIDSTTGRPLSTDAALAIEWNEPHDVINAWQRKSSGLSMSQKIFSVLTCQSDACTIS